MRKLSNKIILARAKEISTWYGFSFGKAVRLVIMEHMNGKSTDEISMPSVQNTRTD